MRTVPAARQKKDTRVRHVNEVVIRERAQSLYNVVAASFQKISNLIYVLFTPFIFAEIIPMHGLTDDDDRFHIGWKLLCGSLL